MKAFSALFACSHGFGVRSSSQKFAAKASRATVDYFFERESWRPWRSHTFACFYCAFAHADLHRVVLLLVAFVQYGHKELTSER